MPGTRLNDIERKALKWWNAKKTLGFLETLEIDGGNGAGLRGIKSTKIKFDSPVTVISGKNGSGKSTILALSALAFHGSKGHSPRNARNGKYYTFQDFFFKGNGDPDFSGIKITWKYKGSNNPLKIEKRTDKWMHYERRPSKPVHFIGISRCVPAIEQSVLRGHFGGGKRQNPPIKLDEAWTKYLSSILGRPYKEADVRTSAKYKIRSCKNGANYTSFNMGTGEDIVIDILSTIFSAPENSIIVIEEIELGLHPSAQIKIAQLLPKIARDKKIQIILSSHSEYVIDNLPRESRILLERGTDEHLVQYMPSTRLALGSMSNSPLAEMKIFCEDEFARSLIQHALPQDIRKRVDILPIGSDSELTTQVAHHIKSGEKHKTLIVWDGEVSFKKIKDWHKIFHNIPNTISNFTRLPGNTPPEEWTINKLLKSQDAILEITEKFSISSQNETIDILSEAETNLDQHSLSETFSRRLNITPEAANELIVKITTTIFTNDFKHIAELAYNILDA